ncbi:hypothetical protein VQL36_08700 [Chengkuizengella sp. SCS-71B]|uniref:hypothetical protein n=1 Tax=Chengkuizengella sp. SCS-71B TaxID=3115290 RepID=UPI0032C2391B
MKYGNSHLLLSGYFRVYFLTCILQDMIEEWEEAKRIPAGKNDFITKRFNIFVKSYEQSFLDYQVIKRNIRLL